MKYVITAAVLITISYMLIDIIISYCKNPIRTYTKKFNKIKKKAENGDIEAMYKIGIGYLYHPFQIENENAIIWLKKAALAGHIDAIKTLVDCYKYGKRVPSDENEAIKWDKKLRHRKKYE